MGLFGSIGSSIGGVANTALSFIPGVGDYMAAKDANEANVTSAREQMDFQERMSNTGYQRAVTDMQKAGLNPMLAYSQGPASTPTGAKADIVPESKTGLAAAAMQAYGLHTQAKSAKAQIALNEAQATTQARQAPYVEAQTQVARQDAKIKEYQASSAKAEADFNKHRAEVDKNWYEKEKWLNAAGSGLGLINKAKDALNPFKGLFGGDKTELPKPPRSTKTTTTYY